MSYDLSNNNYTYSNNNNKHQIDYRENAFNNNNSNLKLPLHRAYSDSSHFSQGSNSINNTSTNSQSNNSRGNNSPHTRSHTYGDQKRVKPGKPMLYTIHILLLTCIFIILYTQHSLTTAYIDLVIEDVIDFMSERKACTQLILTKADFPKYVLTYTTHTLSYTLQYIYILLPIPYI